jgi:hypothetical protein
LKKIKFGFGKAAAAAGAAAGGARPPSPVVPQAAPSLVDQLDKLDQSRAF